MTSRNQQIRASLHVVKAWQISDCCAPAACRRRLLHCTRTLRDSSSRLSSTTPSQLQLDERSRPPSIAPKYHIDVKHIRQNPDLHRQNCLDRKYHHLADVPARINALHAEWHGLQEQAKGLRTRLRQLREDIKKTATAAANDGHTGEAGERPSSTSIDEARQIKQQLCGLEKRETAIQERIPQLAASLPALMSKDSPIGSEPTLVAYINASEASTSSWARRGPGRSHIDIGKRLGILDLSSSATVSGWGWYYFTSIGVLLEQALLAHAQSVCIAHGFDLVSPPSVVYSHIAAACGFQPRDQNGESQIYRLAQGSSSASSPNSDAQSASQAKPEHSLAGTAEIPLAGMHANQTLDASTLPDLRVASSRCYRAEAGARGRDTSGLYRVHEFTKLEMFAWSRPDMAAAEDVWMRMLDVQMQIVRDLGLPARVLEMPSGDLGASAVRKRDIEVWFPSRAEPAVLAAGKPGTRADTKDAPSARISAAGPAAAAAALALSASRAWGEITSASICGDYQTRRLGTRCRERAAAGRLTWPWTVNGTALAVPRVWAAVVENGWDEARRCVVLPECLWKGVGRREIGMPVGVGPG